MIEAIFLLTGLIIFIGFFSMTFFERTKVPDVLILMSVGLILGLVLDEGQVALFNSIAPYVGAVALMMILFDGGLNLNLFRVVKEVAQALAFTLISFLLSCLFVMGIMHYFFGWSVLEGLLLGAILGGTSSAIVISTVSNISVNNASKIILFLESAISDALCIVVALAVMEVMLFNQLSVRDSLNELIGTFSIAIVMAIVVSVLWVGVLKRFHVPPFGHLLTVGIIFIMYSVVEFIGGNGAISVLVFGLILGNASHLGRFFRLHDKVRIDTTIKSFQKEFTFFIRTFFFVYIGLIFKRSALTSTVVSTSVIILAAIFIARIISVKLLTIKTKSLRDYEIVLFSMLPRGLAAAVLSSIPYSKGIMMDSLPEIIFLIIIFTNITTTIGAIVYEKRNKNLAAENGKNNKCQ